jgi:nucleoside-diphosphate-sugar epimerase
MKLLFIGGTGNISAACVRLALTHGHEVFVFNRGNLIGDKAHSSIYDNSKIKRFVPGFQALIPFHAGVRRTLAWFEAEASRRKIIPAISQTMDGYIACWRSAVSTLSKR